MKAYFNEDGERHGVNGAAIDWEDGDYDWWYNGQRHRYYGPACHYNHYDQYCIFGEEIE